MKRIFTLISLCLLLMSGMKTFATCQANFTFTQPFGNVVNFMNTSTGMTASTLFQWDFGDVTNSTFESPVHTYFIPGTYHVCLTISDTGGCQSMYCDSIVVTGNNCNNLTFTATINNVIGCPNNANGKINVAATGGAPLYLYSIDGGSTWIPVNIFTNLTSGLYPVCVKDMNSCVACGDVLVGGPAPITFTTSVTNALCGTCPTGSINVTASGGNGPYAYSKDCGVTYQAANPIGALLPGTYYIRVRDVNGCLSACDTVVVGPLVTGINEQETGNDWVVFPNPSSTTISFKHSTKSTNPAYQPINITDLMGRAIYKEIITNSIITIDVSTWSKGMYFYEIGGKRGKFIKE